MVDTEKIKSMLQDARTYFEITQQTGASSATIAKIARSLREAQIHNGIEPTVDDPLIPKDSTPVEQSVDILSSVDELYRWSKELSRLCKAFRSPHCKNYEMAYQRLRAWKANQPPGFLQ